CLEAVFALVWRRERPVRLSNQVELTEEPPAGSLAMVEERRCRSGAVGFLSAGNRGDQQNCEAETERRHAAPILSRSITVDYFVTPGSDETRQSPPWPAADEL